MKTKEIIVCMLLAISTNIYGQDESPHRQANYAIGLKVGTEGLGLSIAKSLSPSTTFSVEGHFLSLNESINYTFSGTSLGLQTRVHRESISSKFNICLWPSSSFSLFGGLAFHFNNEALLTYQSNQVVQIGTQTTVTPQRYGRIDLTIRNRRVAPFLGFAFGHEIPKKRIGCRLELGTYIYGSPQIELKGTGMLTNIVNQEEQIRKNLRDYRYYPIVAIRASYKLN